MDSQLKDRSKQSQQISEEEQQKIAEARKKAQKAVKKRVSKGGITEYKYHIVVGGFILVCIVALCSAFMGDHRKLNQIPVIEDLYMEKMKAQGDMGYTLGENDFFKDLKLSDAKQMLTNNQLSNKPSIYRCASESDTSIIPSQFNFYQEYSECEQIIMNQGNCSSAYSIAAVQSLSDRFCLHTYKNQKKVRPNLSAQTVISCNSEKNFQCKGGAVTTIFDYAKRQGLVDESCLPYDKENPEAQQCVTENCEKYYANDYCLATDIETIKKEIYKNGPVVGMMTLYRDFLIYKEGVYNPEDGTSKFRTGQAVKIYGWGNDEQYGDYWLIQNSWGKSWGEEGTAKIKVKIADNYLDMFAVAAMPKVEKEMEPVKEDETLESKESKEEEINADNLEIDELEQ